jgi:predicted ATPase/DNA-binding SARP family transcriptional activator
MVCRVYLLGVFRIERRAQTIHLPTRKVESLLAYLALFPEAHSREKLAALFWGDFTDEQARLSLRVALSTLRKELGDDFLLTDRETVQINPDFPLWVDAQEFKDEGGTLRVKDESSFILPPSSLILYTGDLLPDFYDDWVAPERERLRTLYLDALLRLVQHARTEGKYARAIELAQRVLAAERANEKAHQHLMVCYATMGNRAAALKQYEDCVRALRDELGVAPSAETTALCARIQTQAAAAKSPEAAFTNLPVPLSSFVGREREQRELRELLGTSRLVTLTGAGGCGKTRLAIRVATELAAADRFQHGVWWVDLAALNDPALVTQAVATVFNLGEAQGAALLSALTNYLRAKELLLVMDNCEHLLGACAQLIGTLLSACPRLRVLATSREVLNISGETAWRVPSLAVPDIVMLPPLAQLRQYDAIQLFVERATAVAANWRLVENAAPAAQVCARLDGIPLAIELATARLKVLSAQEIAARLDDRFNLLTGGSRSALPRHQTLRATMDWSYDLLSDAERSLLRRLSVFASGFSLEAVEAVCAGEQGGRGAGEISPLLPCSPAPLLDLLTSLIDKSLLVIETRDTATRYRLLETVRQYAREKLAAANESAIYARRHRDWFLQVAEQADPKVRSREQIEWCARLELDMENFRAALTWSLEQTERADAESALRLAGVLWWFWLIRGYWNEARTWFERTLGHCAISPARALPLIALGVMEYFVGKQNNSAALFAEGFALYREQGDKRGIAFAASLLGSTGHDPAKSSALFDEARATAQELNDAWLAARTDIGQGMFYAFQGEPARAGAFFESALVHARVAGDRWFIRNSLDYLGTAAFDLGDDDRAATLFAESLEVSRELGNKNGVALQLTKLGRVALRRRDYRQARALFAQALALRREMGNPRGVLECLWAFSAVAAAEQQSKRAARLLGAASALREMASAKDRRAYEDDVSAQRAQLGDVAFDKAWAEGHAMSLEQAVEYALEGRGNPV